MSKLSLKQRYKKPSPPLFIKIQKWAVFAAFAIPAFTASMTQAFPDSPIVQKVLLILGGLGGFASLIVKIIAKLPVDESK